MSSCREVVDVEERAGDGYRVGGLIVESTSSDVDVRERFRGGSGGSELDTELDRRVRCSSSSSENGELGKTFERRSSQEIGRVDSNLCV